MRFLRAVRVSLFPIIAHPEAQKKLRHFFFLLSIRKQKDTGKAWKLRYYFKLENIMRLQRIGFAAVLLVSMAFISSCPTTTAPVYERIVIETYKYDETAANVDTYLRLYDSAGTLLAENDNISMGNLFSWIDYQKGLGPGTYYIKIDSEATPFPNIGPYVIRALSLKLGEAIPDYIYPGSPAIEAYPDGDDDPATGDMTTPKDLPLGTYLNRYLTTSPDHVPPPYEVDWCKLELP